MILHSAVGALLDNAQGPETIAVESGQYFVETTSNGCRGRSDTLEIIITGLDDFSNGLAPQVYPNPSSHIVHFIIQDDQSNSKPEIFLYDLTGRIVRSQQDFYRKNGTLNAQVLVNDIPDGVYIYVIRIRNRSYKGLVERGK